MSISETDRLPNPAPSPVAVALRQSHEVQAQVARADVDEPKDDSIDLRALLRMVLKHKWTLLASVLLCGAASLVYGLRETPLYRSTLLLQIDRTAQRIMAYKDGDPNQEYYDDGSALRTQIELLRSRSLIERTIDDLGLDVGNTRAIPAFGTDPGGRPVVPTLGGHPGVSPVGNLTLDLQLSPSRTEPHAGTDSKPDPAVGERSVMAPLDELSARLSANYRQIVTPSITDAQVLGREGLVGAFAGSLDVKLVPASRLVQVSVVSVKPEEAARNANALAKAFITLTMERKLESSIYAKNFLEDQIRQTKAKLEESERLLNTYAKSNDILTLDDKSTVVSQNYTDFASALARAEQERIKAEALYKEIARNPDHTIIHGTYNRVIEYHKEQKGRLEAEYLANLGVYKPEFPKMLQLKAQIEEMDKQIKAEIATIVTSYKVVYEAAKRQEEDVRSRLGRSRKDVLITQDRSVNLNLLKRDLDTNRQIYDSLLHRYKELDVTGAVAANNISVVDAAKVPLFPFKPQLGRIAALGLGLGLLLGLAYIFLREQLDDTVKHADEIEALYGLPLLGWVPFVTAKVAAGHAPAMLAHAAPRSPFSEAYRSMRTALQFSTTEGAPRRMMITSCGKSEGKTTTALSLAINFAQMGKNVLLIDADMRNPSVHKAMKISNEVGLSNFLSGDLGREKLIQKSADIPNLSVMTAGPTPPNPVDLLMGPKLLRLLDRAQDLGYSQVIIDAPPMLGIADAIVLGNQIQFIIFAVKASSTRKSNIKSSLRRLRLAGLVPMGVILTHAREQHAPYYAYESYYGYGGAGGQTHAVAKPSAPSGLEDDADGPQPQRA